MVSSDKAVNPTSVMGATKRVAELYVQSLNSRQYAVGSRQSGEMQSAECRVQSEEKTAQKNSTAGTSSHSLPTAYCLLPTNPQPTDPRFVAVRFGNVLGSSGSVVPIFQKQIDAGGPVTVTHPEMKRYFMTIPEASQLVMQAGAIARGGEVFILDMGRPVKIVDLAHELIRRNGLQAGRDIEVRFSGIRPGEKLYEELACDYEQAVPTGHDKIRVWQLPTASADELDEMLAILQTAITGDRHAAVTALARCVPEYQPESLKQSPPLRLVQDESLAA
jgi:FlaA1/EpsC-like NDP-sugar epimerase